MKPIRDHIRDLNEAGKITCPGQVYSALVNIAALIAHSVLIDNARREKAVRIPFEVCALIGEILLWETERISRLPMTPDPRRDRLRMESYELLGRGMRALAHRSADEGRRDDGRP